MQESKEETHSLDVVRASQPRRGLILLLLLPLCTLLYGGSPEPASRPPVIDDERSVLFASDICMDDPLQGVHNSKTTVGKGLSLAIVQWPIAADVKQDFTANRLNSFALGLLATLPKVLTTGNYVDTFVIVLGSEATRRRDPSCGIAESLRIVRNHRNGQQAVAAIASSSACSMVSARPSAWRASKTSSPSAARQPATACS